MPKQKTRKTVAKRFKITARGKVFRGHQYSSHRKFHKSKRLIRSYKRPIQLSSKQEKQIKKLLLT
ncbi:50S ribosomal protein L35 [Candidatus Gottesmanbacteria bacterium RIFCSPLOWO2_02_FULL_38_8]|uniref:Large ribosomal subunit protein bL35 n=1 Tax=Candidatus Gottesmanbacteria bacterium RIFCSPLOWO2_02_FULL_38_8 TaxID=1798397 RepID=A0A1F6B2S9_9BACT|nr:MAG: 50S ribosomal protein L35 [Candidatus Gottesmanbacteria bacterium RIFCSPLOWO2_02_FULL_38_8]